MWSFLAHLGDSTDEEVNDVVLLPVPLPGVTVGISESLDDMRDRSLCLVQALLFELHLWVSGVWGAAVRDTIGPSVSPDGPAHTSGDWP